MNRHATNANDLTGLRTGLPECICPSSAGCHSADSSDTPNRPDDDANYLSPRAASGHAEWMTSGNILQAVSLNLFAGFLVGAATLHPNKAIIGALFPSMG